MSLTPRLTLIGLYKYNPAVFSNLTLPAAVDEETFIDSLLLEYGECPLIYPDYDFMKLAIGAWCRKWYANIERIAAALTASYNPIHNYDRTETWTENETTEKESTRENETETEDSETESGTNEHQISAYNENTYQPSEKDLYSKTNSKTGSGTINETANENGERQNVKTGRTYGNIGITESTQMVQHELDLRSTENLYHIIAELFYKEFCLYVF